MVTCNYKDKEGHSQIFDLSKAVRIAEGESAERSGWEATIVYIPEYGTLVELRSGPEDVRGNAPGEAVQVSSDYVLRGFPISKGQLRQLTNGRA